MIQTWILVPTAGIAALRNLNQKDAAVEPRLIDDPAANTLGFGMLLGKYVLPARIADDPRYSRWASRIAAIPRGDADAEDLFLPSTDP
jgi:hypothetical protein